MAAVRKLLSRVLSHNDNHFFIVNMEGEDVRLCTRCTGMLIGFAVSILPIILFETNHASGKLITGIAILLSLLDFFYWILTRIQLVPDKNGIRVMTGIMLGVGISLFGQASINWLLKIPLMILPFLAIFVLNPILGRKIVLRKS